MVFQKCSLNINVKGVFEGVTCLLKNEVTPIKKSGGLQPVRTASKFKHLV
jgi:hypothetical protein